jgi:hypothetical protein
MTSWDDPGRRTSRTAVCLSVVALVLLGLSLALGVRSVAASRSKNVAAIRSVFGHGAIGDRAVKVSWCESRLYERTVSRTDDWGLFALHRSVWDPARNSRARPYWPRGKDWRNVFDPLVNARVAYAISRRGTDFWTHWKWSAGCWA